MSDQIRISQLRAMAVIGALPHEREGRQPLQIDLVLEVDLHDAGRSDDLDDTVHYGLVAERVIDVATETKDVLLERLAARLAEEVLAFPRVDAVEVTVTKLRPPIPVDAGTTSVTIHRTALEHGAAGPVVHRAFIALGSNLGDREGFLRAAIRGLPPVVAQSQVWETDPVGGPEGQDAYLNMVVEVETVLDPFALLRRCQRLESEALRQRVVRWGPRTLDVDIILFDDISIVSDDLTIPHPRFTERRFVLAPLAELAPERCPPGWDDELEPAGVHPRGRLASLPGGR